MTSPTKRGIDELLGAAVSHVQPAPGRETWDYGWSLPDYRRSARAAIESPNGPVTIVGAGLQAWEEAVGLLLKEPGISARWAPDEFWGTLAGMTAAAASAENPDQFISAALVKLRKAKPSLMVTLIANVAWDTPPNSIGDAIVGNADARFFKLISESARKRPKLSDDQTDQWLTEQVLPRFEQPNEAPPVALATWSAGQGELAFTDAERKLRNITDLTLLLEKDLNAHAVYRRGSTNRPGVRGLTLDRGAIERSLTGTSQLELAARPLFLSGTFGARGHTRWYGSEPFPLGPLLEQSYLLAGVESCLRDDPISNRIKVAARWFAEAHYSNADDDSALALGVATDALLTGQRALPGSAMADRYALLAREPERRRDLVSDYLMFYGVRSSVAHGGKSSKLDDGDFLARYSAAVQWAAWRLIDVRDTFSPASEKDLDSVFDDLRWGVRIWSRAS